MQLKDKADGLVAKTVQVFQGHQILEQPSPA